MEKGDVQDNIPYVREVKQIIQNIKIKSNSSFILNDQIYEVSSLGEKNANENSINLKKIKLTNLLGDTLYRLIHCREEFIDKEISRYYDSFDEGYGNRIFVELLSKANSSLGNWETGWKVCKIERNGKIVVKKNDLMIWTTSRQFLPLNSNYIDIGGEGSVLMGKEYRELLPGFYMANGNKSMRDKSFVVRIYWNISSNGAVFLMKSLTTTLNKENIPFQFKILNNESYYRRADSGVLYMDKQDIKKARNALSAIYKDINSFLKPSVPLFAKKLNAGISLAEDPSNGESFGQNRCRLFAESIYDAFT